jgi:seryl-tRNA(Sec) selenium transferase
MLVKNNRIFQMLEKKPAEIHEQAQRFHEGLDKLGIPSIVLDSEGYCGGGALPGEAIQSFAVKLNENFDSNKQKSLFGERIYHGLMDHETPVVAILKKGEVFFDMLTIPEEEVEMILSIVNEVYREVKSK